MKAISTKHLYPNNENFIIKILLLIVLHPRVPYFANQGCLQMKHLLNW